MLTAQMFHSKDGLAQLARLSDSAFVYFRADAHRRLRRITLPSKSSQDGLESY